MSAQQVSRTKNRKKHTYVTADQHLRELELMLNLGVRLSDRQLLKLLARCNQIVKDQLRVVVKK